MYTLDWLGGFFDGEGCVSLIHTPNGKKNGQRTFRLFLSIAQKNTHPLEWVKQHFGGCIKKHKSGTSQWSLSGKYLEPFLAAILPYTMLKRPALEKALEYRELMKTRPKGRGAAYPPELIQKCQAIKTEIQRLNSID